MSTNILFVVEGQRTEIQIIESLQSLIFEDKVIIKCAYATDIYKLYRDIKNDEDLDTFNLIKEKSNNKPLLEGYCRDDFSEIYLFFDYDTHADLASNQDSFGNKVKDGDEKLLEMFEIFNNETENGKLYISYPMVESIKHISSYEDFQNVIVKCKGKNCIHINDCSNSKDSTEINECIEVVKKYKNIASVECLNILNDITTYNLDIWKLIINSHLSKMNLIVNNNYRCPDKIEEQIVIFQNQHEKYINKICPTVSVLSAFPIFVHDYYGNKRTYEIFQIE